VLGPLAVTAALAAAPGTAGAWHPDIAAAGAFARARRGTVSFAVRTPCGSWGDRQNAAVPSASVLKAMLLVAELRRAGVRDRPLDAGQRRLLGPMIRWSDNADATRVFALVGGGPLARDARRWGMRHFAVGSPWGMSRITARDQARFWLHLDAHVPPRHRAYALTLLHTIAGPQRWGIGQVAPAGWTLYFKGGWGSGTGRVDHQVALLTRGDQRVSVAILTMAQGTHAYGKRTLRGMAARLLAGLAGRTAVC